MISAIFNDELNTIESAIAQYQALIEAKRLEADNLKQAQSTTDSALQSLQDALAAVKTLAPDAIGKLKSAILDLFRGDNGTDGGNEPEPTPEPPTDGGLPSFDNFVTEVKEAIATEPEPLPVVEPEPEPAPANQKQPFTELKMLSQDVGYLVNKHGEVLAGYAGFTSRQKAEKKGKELRELLHMGFEIRDTSSHQKRLPHKYELKMLDINLNQLQRLADEMNPKVEPVIEQLPPTGTSFEMGLEPEGFKPRFTFNAAPDTSNLMEIYLVYEGDTYLGKVTKSSVSGKWSIPRDSRDFATREAAADLLSTRVKYEKRVHEESNKGIIENFMRAS